MRICWISRRFERLVRAVGKRIKGARDWLRQGWVFCVRSLVLPDRIGGGGGKGEGMAPLLTTREVQHPLTTLAKEI